MPIFILIDNKLISDPGLAYITNAGVAVPGDVNGDGVVTLADAILALQIGARISPAGQTITNTADVNNDGRIGLHEVIYILQKAAGVRQN